MTIRTNDPRATCVVVSTDGPDGVAAAEMVALYGPGAHVYAPPVGEARYHTDQPCSTCGATARADIHVWTCFTCGLPYVGTVLRHADSEEHHAIVKGIRGW